VTTPPAKAGGVVTKQQLIDAGFGNEIQWCADRRACGSAETFFLEYMWVVINSGMKNQIAEKIYQKLLIAIKDRTPLHDAFGHAGKVTAIEKVRSEHKKLFKQYQESTDKLAFLEGLPWIGKITKFHLARNLGMDVCKPDRHLVRIASKYNTTPEQLCSVLSVDTGDRIGTVDVVLWRAANLGFL
jgi:hypothetical protein